MWSQPRPADLGGQSRYFLKSVILNEVRDLCLDHRDPSPAAQDDNDNLHTSGAPLYGNEPAIFEIAATDPTLDRLSRVLYNPPNRGD
jgi:hypothetical protein